MSVSALPRKGGARQPKLATKSKEACKKRIQTMDEGAFRHAHSGSSAAQLAATGSHVSRRQPPAS